MKKILIVEDDKFLANAHRVKLTKSGFETVVAYDGAAAIDALKTFTPDLILLDLIIPVKDGFTVLTEIKQNANLKSVPVIVTSNLSQKEDVDRAMKIGATDYMVKSNIDLNDLIKKIDKYLK